MRVKLFLILVLLVSVTSLFADEWYQTYDAAKKAIASQQWAVAEQKLNDCLKKNPTQGRHEQTYGLIYTVYIPDYYLGVVYFNQGKYQQSLDQFKKVQSAGLVTSAHPEYAAMAKMKQDATEKLAASQPKPAETQQPGNQIATKQPVPQPYQPSQTPTPAQRPEDQQRVATASLAQAQKMIDLRQYDQARNQARIALSQGASEGDVSSLLRKIDVQQKLEDLRRAITNSDWSEAQNLIREIESVDPNNAEARKYEKTIDASLARTRSDDVVKNAMLAFYSGRYDQTIDLLQRALPADETAEVHFYIGCSYAAQAFLQTADRENLLSQAKQEFAKVHKMDPGFRPADRSISPRILRLSLSPQL